MNNHGSSSSSQSNGPGGDTDALTRRRHGTIRRVMKRRRLILRNGTCNVAHGRSSGFRLRLLQDFFTTMVDLPWRWTLIILQLSFFLSWLAFAIMWWLIALAHGDLDPHHLPPFQEEEKWIPCVTQIYNFTSCFMFSMENQHTTGFGARMPTEECPEAIFLMCMQAIVGVTIQTAMLGIVFAKIIRPKQRARTILFSRNAVICYRDSQPCLMFRVADMRIRSHIIETKVKAMLIMERVTPEGELLLQDQRQLLMMPKDKHIMLLWPQTMVHVIDHHSPLYGLTASDMSRVNFEIAVFLEGTIESTDQRVQARMSYMPPDILWGRRFSASMTFNSTHRRWEFDPSGIHSTEIAPTLLDSALRQETHTTLREEDEDDETTNMLPYTGKVKRTEVM